MITATFSRTAQQWYPSEVVNPEERFEFVVRSISLELALFDGRDEWQTEDVSPLAERLQEMQSELDEAYSGDFYDKRYAEVSAQIRAQLSEIELTETYEVDGVISVVVIGYQNPYY